MSQNSTPFYMSYYPAPHFIHEADLTHAEIMVFLVLCKIRVARSLDSFMNRPHLLDPFSFIATTKQLCQYSKLGRQTVYESRSRLQFKGYINYWKVSQGRRVITKYRIKTLRRCTE